MSVTASQWADSESPAVLSSLPANLGLASDHAVSLLHKMAGRVLANAPMQEVLADVVACVTSVVRCDSCFIYVLEHNQLILRASKNPHPEIIDRLKLQLG